MKIKDFMWLVYPLLVIGFMFFSAQLLLGSGQTSLEYLSGKQQSIVEAQAKTAKLKVKVGTLNSVNETAVNNELKQMLAAVPAENQAAVVLRGIKVAAQSAGLTIEGYISPIVGDVKEATPSGQTSTLTGTEPPFKIDVTVNMSNLSQLQQFTSSLESQLPVLRVVGVKWLSGSAVISVVPAYKPWKKVNLSVDDPLPNYADKVVKAQQVLSSYAEASVPPEASASGGTASPF